jgi:tRNA (cytidine32/guanosine34-2'-O)-methyltransferase
VTVAKPKSSRNSSIESFVVCRRYQPPDDFVPSMTALLQGHKYGSQKFFSLILPRYGPGNELLGLSNLVVPFVACGDLNGFDSDKSYPLQLSVAPSSLTLSGQSGAESGSYTYTYRQPVQPPIRPNYHTYQTQFQQNQKGNKTTLLEI